MTTTEKTIEAAKATWGAWPNACRDVLIRVIDSGQIGTFGVLLLLVIAAFRADIEGVMRVMAALQQWAMFGWCLFGITLVGGVATLVIQRRGYRKQIDTLSTKLDQARHQAGQRPKISSNSRKGNHVTSG